MKQNTDSNSEFNHGGDRTSKLSKGELKLLEQLKHFTGDKMPLYSFTLSNDLAAPKHFFTADTHFKDSRKYTRDQRSQIIHYGVDAFDDFMRDNWNKTVRSQDHIWIVGDFSTLKDEESTKNFLNTLNGTKHLILGGHDMTAATQHGLFNHKVFDTVDPHVYIEFTLPDESKEHFYARHYYDIHNFNPQTVNWPGKESGTTMVHGHTHGFHDDRPCENSFDVGVNAFNFYPVEAREILEERKSKDPNRIRITENFAPNKSNQDKLNIQKQNTNQYWKINKSR